MTLPVLQCEWKCNFGFGRVSDILSFWFAVMLIAVPVAFWFAYIFPRLLTDNEYFWIAVPLFQVAITYYLMFLCSATNPGRLPVHHRYRRIWSAYEKSKHFPKHFSEPVLSDPIPLRYCLTCHHYTHNRSHHCSICNHCFQKFDHHCIWLNNCIGERNYPIFLMFLISLILLLVVNGVQLGVRAYLWFEEEVGFIALGITIYMAVVFVPIFVLFVYHLHFIRKGITTYEWIKGIWNSRKNPFDSGGFITNWFRIFMKSRPPVIPADYGNDEKPKELPSDTPHESAPLLE